MRAALVHDWVVTPGGAERCLAVFHELYPKAPLYTLFYNDKEIRKLGFAQEEVQASFLQGKKTILERYRNFLPLFPYAIEQLDLSDYDLILSSSHCVAKGVLTRADQLHICYCHTPVRYAWDLTHRYLQENSLTRGLKSTIARMVLHYLRMWDIQSSNRVDYFIANSHYTARRIWRAYRREATVIYPPVDLEIFPLLEKKENYFLFVSRLVPYKQAELVIETFNRTGNELKVVGDGPQLNRCHRLSGKNVEIMGYRTGSELAEIMGRARALIFAADEDFGITPVEAQACGTPVIAFGRGGVTETVIPANGNNWDQATGIFFFEQTVSQLECAIGQFLDWEGNFNPLVIRHNAERFNSLRFKADVQAFINSKYQEWTKS
ncbi:MAG: glycosyl transferase [Firmicutes bacterium HGW-Firmicutes-15]|nr:MAG: glycosyl transferase [Firmicutes bacterium HGW-Firmicutes-15]